MGRNIGLFIEQALFFPPSLPPPGATELYHRISVGFGSCVHIPAVPLSHGGTLGQYFTPELQGVHLQHWRKCNRGGTSMRHKQITFGFQCWVAGFLTFYTSM